MAEKQRYNLNELYSYITFQSYSTYKEVKLIIAPIMSSDIITAVSISNKCANSC